eukprot:234393_1
MAFSKWLWIISCGVGTVIWNYILIFTVYKMDKNHRNIQLAWNDISYDTDPYIHNKSCELLFQNNTSITDEIIYCEKDFVDIIFTFYSYCNDLSLYWFHRVLYSTTFLSTKIPKYIFILIHNINGKECTLYNKDKRLYRWLISYLTKYFNVNIIIYFNDTLLSSANSRNFLAFEIKKFISSQMDASGKHKILNRYGGNIIVSYLDGDDVIHPKRFEQLDQLYANNKINGTVLTGFSFHDCRMYGKFEQNHYEYYFKMFKNLDNYLYNVNRTQFHIYQSKYLLRQFAFENYDFDLKTVKVTQEMMNFTTDFHHLWAYQCKYSRGCCPSNGWPTIVLESLTETNKYKNFAAVEDLMFNFDTLNYGYDLHLYPFRLGIYCQGNIENKLRIGNKWDSFE